MKLIKEVLEGITCGDAEIVSGLYDEYYEQLQSVLKCITRETEKDDYNYRLHLMERAYRAMVDAVGASHESRLLSIIKTTNRHSNKVKLHKLILERMMNSIQLVSFTVRLYELDEVSTRVRKTQDERKNEILNAAIDLAKEGNYANITQNQIAKSIGVSMPLISKYYTMDDLKQAVVKFAVEADIVEIIAQGIANKNPITSTITEEQRDSAVKYLMSH